MVEKETQPTLPIPRLTRRRLLAASGVFALAYLGSKLSQIAPISIQEESSALSTSTFLPHRINGLNFPSWRQGEYQESAAQDAFRGMAEVSPNLIGIKVTQYQYRFDTTDIYPTGNTPDKEDLRAVIDLAHQLGYKVMLAPQINLTSDPEHWHGEIGSNFSELDWQGWFCSYRSMIYNYADLAQEVGVELFVVGNEYIQASKRAGDWRTTIAGIRRRYSGPLTYASHFHEFNSIPWWEDLDLMGLNPYYKLHETGTPALDSLKGFWSNIIREIEPTVTRSGKRLVFPEIGYFSATGVSREPWNYQLISDPNVPINVHEQAICYQSVYESFWSYPWWQGVCWWYWNSDPSVNGINNKEYSPRGKPAAEVIAYYSKVLSNSP